MNREGENVPYRCACRSATRNIAGGMTRHGQARPGIRPSTQVRPWRWFGAAMAAAQGRESRMPPPRHGQVMTLPPSCHHANMPTCQTCQTPNISNMPWRTPNPHPSSPSSFPAQSLPCPSQPSPRRASAWHVCACLCVPGRAYATGAGRRRALQPPPAPHGMPGTRPHAWLNSAQPSPSQASPASASPVAQPGVSPCRRPCRLAGSSCLAARRCRCAPRCCCGFHWRAGPIAGFRPLSGRFPPCVRGCG